MIPPTIGRVVWVYRRFEVRDLTQPEVGFIVDVIDNRQISVAGFDSHGDPFKLRRIVLLQDNDLKPDTDFAVWMPYQKGQAAKTEELQAKLA